MEEIDITRYREFNKSIVRAYEILGLKTIMQSDFNGKNSLTLFSDTLRAKESIIELPYSDFKIHDELNAITNDIIYVCAMLYILRPYINNTFHTGGIYDQKLEDKRYLRYANFGIQSIYNYWDRLGDMLNLFFRTGLKSDSVYINRVLNNFPSEYKSSEQYVAIKTLFEKEILPVFDLRHKSVHHFQIETDFQWKNYEMFNDNRKLDELRRMNEIKLGYVEVMITQLSNCITGFRLALELIAILPDKKHM